MAEPIKLSVPMGTPRPPPFWEMGEYSFQDFCQSVWRLERVECQLYGRRGQKQHGIDLRTFGQPSGHGSVGQCKCYEKFKDSDLRQAVKDFTDHLAFWRGHKIKVFRLYVASSCADTKIQTEYATQKASLEREQIDFQLCDNSALADLVRSEPTIVSRFCGDDWVKILCGGGAIEVAPETVIASAMHLSKNGAIFVEWEAYRDKDLEELREQVRCGKGDGAYAAAVEILESADWNRFTPKLRAKTLRLLFAIECNRGQVAKAAEWLEKAKAEDPEGDFQVAEALYSLKTIGVEGARSLVATPLSIDAWNLLAVLDVNQGKVSDVLSAFDAPPFPLNAESYRIKAMGLLLSGRLDEAVQAADTALHLAPGWTETRRTWAIVMYQSTLATSFAFWKLLDWPRPPDWPFIKMDSPALERLRKASGVFKQLLSESNEITEDHANLETWLLASYANDPEKRAEAAELTQAVLDRVPTHFRFISWALERHLPFDVEKSRQNLRQLLTSGEQPLNLVLSLVYLEGVDGEPEKVRAVLEQYKDAFVRQGGLSVWRNAMIQALVQADKVDEANRILDEETDATVRRGLRATLAETRFKKGGTAKALADELEVIFREGDDPTDLLAAAEAKLQAKEPAFVVEHRDRLLQHFPNIGVIRLLTFAAFMGGQPSLVLELLDQNANLIPDSGLPDDTARIRIQSLRALGQLTRAVEYARASDWAGTVREHSRIDHASCCDR